MKFSIKPRFERSLQPILAASALLVASVSAEAAAYIKFDGLDGESTQKDHKNWCDVVSVNMGGHRAGSGTAAAKVVFKEFTVTKKTDRTSPKLMEAVCLGRHIPKVEFHLTEEGADGEHTYYIIELENVLVTSYSLGGSASSAPTEEMSLNYERIKVIHVDQAGTKGGNVEFEWKVEEGES